MALARVVEFEGVGSDRMQQMRQEMEGGQPPEGMPPAEIIVLHDAGSEKSLVMLLLDSEEDYAKADQVLNAMDTSDTPGRRTSVKKYDVAMRRSS
jgi:hypothetical protein